ncbi:O-glucosyltransferase rumi-like [Musca domestica]|uniref:O-glucosyltransferase rumi-like n=1 Tax=Musca domestica TaxID=7370 RepID=A0ABM3VNR5_MUSDO|nr:O-glucosyltransferase rumi-like [Musca domestica]
MRFPILFVLFINLLQLLNITAETIQQDVTSKGMCTEETANGCEDSSKAESTTNNRNDDAASQRIVSKIEKTWVKYKSCSAEPQDPKCECHQKVWQKDLEVFQKQSITKQNIKDATKFGTLYKIFNQKLYRTADCFFPARCEGIEYFLLKIAPSLPNMDFVVNTRDYPQVSGRFARDVLPVFSFSKTSDYRDIMYPAWTFWAGGPAIKLFPTGIGRWDIQREKINKAGLEFPWEKKIAKGFFRGSRTSHERDSLVLLSRSNPNLIDAAYTKNQAWKSLKDTLDEEPAQEVSFEYHCQFKYLFNFRGVAASFRFKHLFLCRSLVFHVGNEWLEFFYPALKPWKHYVPLDKNPSQSEIKEIMEFFRRNDDLAKNIAEAGYEFIWHHLRMEDIECYWKHLMTNYSKLLKYEVVEDKSLIEIKEKKSNNQKRRRSDEF